MSDVRINTRSPYYVEANPTEPTQPTIPDPIEENTPPTVTITASNTTPYLGETVTLTAVATDSDGTIVSYEWGGFGSGSTQSITATNTSLFESQIFSVVVTDNDGDTASAITTINWQEVPEQTTNTDIDVNCGDVINEGSFSGVKNYHLRVGDKIGDVEVEFLTGGGLQSHPVIFDMTWNGNTETTGYIGYSEEVFGTLPDTDNTGDPTTKSQPTTLTINKTSAEPKEVILKARPLGTNDSYSFRLNCPDVEAVETFYYTLTGTCTSGSTTFNYTDVNGDTQTVVLANGEKQLVSAQEDTVSTAVCTGTAEKGGESFDLGTPELNVDINTEFRFWLDTSGSLGKVGTGGEVNEIAKMTENQLKNAFLTYYNNDSVLYNEKVIYTEDDTERPLLWGANTVQNANSTKVCHLIYVDELKPNYHSGVVGDNTQTLRYGLDLPVLRTALDSANNYGDHIVIVFCIEKDRSTTYRQFSHFIDNVSTGANGFDGSNGLSDRSEVIFVRNVIPNNISDYYYQVTVDALRSLGFNI